MKIKQLFIAANNKIEALSDKVAYLSGKPLFLVAHLVWWGLWVGFKVEPFPYGLLTLIVSLEAICLSGLILSASNRMAEKDRKMMIEEFELTE